MNTTTLLEDQLLSKSWSRLFLMEWNISIKMNQKRKFLVITEIDTNRTLLERWNSSKVVEAVREIREESGGQSFKFPIKI
jgi:hypothetical protein